MLARSSRQSCFRFCIAFDAILCRTSSTSATTISSMSTAQTSLTIPVNKERSKAQIQELVASRVQERNAWKVNCESMKPMPPMKDLLKFLAKWVLFGTPKPPSQAELDETLPVLPMDWETIKNPMIDQIQVTWLGHASVLVQMKGCNIVTDPVFSQRCSPSQWFGPQRFRAAPCSIAELCSHVDIDLVLISHNHYDHLDYNTVKDLCECSNAQFVVPLGLREWFRKHVGTAIDIYELDWNESMECNNNNNNDKTSNKNALRVTSVGMRHWSNRMSDRDQTLWCGYSIQAGKQKFLFPGDTAWFDALEDVGKIHGPFDAAAIPIGAYEPRDFMKYNHINVPEAVRMKDAIQAKGAVPIHWGTFPLTTEPVLEPREKLLECMSSRPDAESFVPWLIGETKQF